MAQNMAEINQRMTRAAQEGDVNCLYDLIKLVPDFLERIDRIPFVHTPLHVAAAAGNTNFAIQIMSLMPSYSRKLNLDGLSPLDLALRNGHIETARRVTKIDIAAQEGDINALYDLLKLVPDLLEAIDEVPFVHTPLHVAAAAGRSHFALEMMRLKPSFSRKLNPDGFSPVDLALRNGRMATVRRLIRIDRELIRVRGKEGFTPLHYVAQIDDTNHLLQFLLACPASVEDLTIRDESVAHVAVKNRNIGAFKVLLGWLRRNNKVALLTWRDEDGNTVLHIAASTNQPQFLRPLAKFVYTNTTNLSKQTALDIVLGLPFDENKEEAKRILSEATFRCSPWLMVFIDKIRLWLRLQVGADPDFSSDLRDTVLVVAVLIVTATYQGVLSPPGGLSEGDSNAAANSTTTTVAGKSTLPALQFKQWSTTNSIALASGAAMIFVSVPVRTSTIFLHVSLLGLMASYFYCLGYISPQEDSKSVVIRSSLYLVGIIVLMVLFNLWPTFERTVDNILGQGRQSEATRGEQNPP